jgi:ppGpp synthetase/RelA/SpoT-type nucleotidyltranferase
MANKIQFEHLLKYKKKNRLEELKNELKEVEKQIKLLREDRLELKDKIEYLKEYS